MKRFILLVVIFALTVCICGCENSSKQKIDNSANAENQVDSAASKDDTASKENNVVSKAVETNGKIDYDISALSTTMAYSQVTEMIQNSSEYLGKTVKIKGTFLAEETEQRNYYLCQISDPTACCSAGFEFVLKNTDLKYPDDYPKQNDEITVTGKFHTYNEGSYVYYELIDAVMIK